MDETVQDLFTCGPFDLESVINTEDLALRPARAAEFERENRALVALAQDMATSPTTILRRLAQTALELCNAQSAGISLLSDDESNFYWPAVEGQWAPHVGGGTPRTFGPCGTVLDRQGPQLFSRPERHFAYLLPVAPGIEEALLTPFYIDGVAVGTIWVVLHDSVRRFDGEDLRLLESLGQFSSAAYQNLSALKRVQESDRRKSEFLSMLAHELRGPLSPISNAVHVLEMDGDRDTVRSVVPMLNRQVRQMTRLVDDLLDLSRVDRGTIALRRETIDIQSVVRQAVEAAQPSRERANLHVEVSMPEEPLQVLGDAARLAQVLGNLLNNACKFTNAGGRIAVDVTRVGDDVMIRVTDTGIGISPDQLPRIFDMFAQVDTSIERSQGGLGIGLTLVKTLVELHDGSVEAASEGVGRGSTFTVRIPILMPGGPDGDLNTHASSNGRA